MLGGKHTVACPWPMYVARCPAVCHWGGSHVAARDGCHLGIEHSHELALATQRHAARGPGGTMAESNASVHPTARTLWPVAPAHTHPVPRGLWGCGAVGLCLHCLGIPTSPPVSMLQGAGL